MSSTRRRDPQLDHDGSLLNSAVCVVVRYDLLGHELFECTAIRIASAERRFDGAGAGARFVGWHLCIKRNLLHPIVCLKILLSLRSVHRYGGFIAVGVIMLSLNDHPIMSTLTFSMFRHEVPSPFKFHRGCSLTLFRKNALVQDFLLVNSFFGSFLTLNSNKKIDRVS
ncbi:hypothetical protein EVAR_99789_1 [Eumeta japonica]|uniref:Uncharacterized protein n=1 Tax=Eumeta variegata TaxID=151549 RepID=A0A4C1ZGC7_EUMVA|nr:hypothetical protein EVAR_99789_1 [Eumeta japonica]